MLYAQTRQRLESLELKSFVAGQREPGRAEMDPGFVEHWTAQHAWAVETLRDPRIDRDTRRLATLLEAITFPLVAQREDPVPDYYPYTGVHLLEWFLGDRHQAWDRLKARSAEGIFHVLRDLIQFESQSLTGLETWSQERFDRTIAAERLTISRRAVDRCYELARTIPDLELTLDHTPLRHATLGEYAAEPSRVSAMVEFSNLPQTRCHDEVIFLRTVHIGEFCFYGIRTAVREAQELILRGLVRAATIPLGQAVAFGAMLYESFKVLRSMPPEHFIDFRHYTGKASAIKSLNYQLLEVHLRGVNPDKLAVFHRIPHLRKLAKFAHPEFVHFRRVLKQARAGDPAWDEVLEVARALDQKWHTWRGLHLAFALLYLPEHVPGTGDTEGAPYLRKFLKAGLFDDTEVDLAVVEELFGSYPEIPNLFRVRPGAAFTPAEPLRAYRGA